MTAGQGANGGPLLNAPEPVAIVGVRSGKTYAVAGEPGNPPERIDVTPQGGAPRGGPVQRGIQRIAQAWPRPQMPFNPVPMG